MSIAKAMAAFLFVSCLAMPVAHAAPVPELSVDESVEIGIGHSQYVTECPGQLLDTYTGEGEAELAVLQYDAGTETWIPDTHTIVRDAEGKAEKTHRILLKGSGDLRRPTIATARIFEPKRLVVVVLLSAAGKTYNQPVGPTFEAQECGRD